jgi:glycosyltransferase involved in cell wall biosynthesis
MKIIQVITELRPGGAERVLAELCIGLRRRGHDVTVVALEPLPRESVIINELREHGIAIESVNLTKSAPWRIFRLRALLKRLQPDVVHSHLIHANLVTRLNMPGAKYKLVNTVHTMESRKSKFWYFLADLLTLPLCGVQTAVSEAARDFHAGKLHVKPDSMPVIYNGIVAPRQLSYEEITQLRNSWGFAGCKAVFGSVGRLGHEKGYDILLKMLPELSRRVPAGEKWGLVIIGEGAERGALERLAKNAPENIVIALPGFRKDASDCIGAFNLFVMPSRYEGFGLVLIEAMAHGVPVIASEIGPLKELLRNYPNGMFFDFKNQPPAMLAELIADKIINGAVSAPDLSFASEKMVEDYLNLYRQLTAEKQ